MHLGHWHPTICSLSLRLTLKNLCLYQLSSSIKRGNLGIMEEVSVPNLSIQTILLLRLVQIRHSYALVEL